MVYFNMTSPESFSDKWSVMEKGENIRAKDEESIFVEPCREPETQRQLNLFYYFRFIRDLVIKNNVQDTLEIGCGRGTVSLYLAEYLNKKTALLDSEESAINLAREAFKKRNLSADFFTADALETKLPGKSYDLIVSIGLAEHIEDVQKLYREQFRLLRTGGLMISLNIPKKFSIQFLNTWLRIVKKMTGTYKQSVKKDYFRNNFTPDDYRNFAARAGFAEIGITHVCPFPIYVPVKMSTDKFITKINKIILKVRELFMPYPFKTNRLLAQAHFLMGYKK